MRSKNLTISALIQARNECAKIISECGEQYLPIFERLEKEIVMLEEREELLKRALMIGQKSGTQNGTQSGTQLRGAFSRCC